MHSEHFVVPREVMEASESASRVIAIGTTATRALETAGATGRLSGRTDIFIRRGPRWSPVALMLPHLHLPQLGVMGAYGKQLLDWLSEYTFPNEARFADPSVCESEARVFLDAMASHGVTTGCVFGTVHPESIDALAVQGHALEPSQLVGLADFLDSIAQVRASLTEATGGPYPALRTILDGARLASLLARRKLLAEQVCSDLKLGQVLERRQGWHAFKSVDQVLECFPSLLRVDRLTPLEPWRAKHVAIVALCVP